MRSSIWTRTWRSIAALRTGASLARLSAAVYWSAAVAGSGAALVSCVMTRWSVFDDALNDPAVRKQFENLGLQMPPKDKLAPDALGAWQKAEIAKWWPVIKAANVKVE